MAAPAAAAAAATTDIFSLRAAAAAVVTLCDERRLQAAAPLPPPVQPAMEQLRWAVLELEARLHAAGRAWLALPGGVRQAWLGAVRLAAHPLELSAALLLLDGAMAPAVRSRAWGQERARSWRTRAPAAVTVSGVAELLLVLDDTCAWDALEKLAAPKPEGKKGGGGTPKGAAAAPPPPPPPQQHRRRSPDEFARSQGEALPVVRWCQVAGAARGDGLRAVVLGELVTLTPREGGGWACTPCGAVVEGGLVDMRGLTTEEATGERITIWYEEGEDEAKVDVPYAGHVAAVHPHGAGLQVHFDQLLANGKIEVINATDEDEWMWGDHTLKPPDYTRFPEVLRDQHSVHHQLVFEAPAGAEAEGEAEEAESVVKEE